LYIEARGRRRSGGDGDVLKINLEEEVPAAAALAPRGGKEGRKYHSLTNLGREEEKQNSFL
jgi:hypothetical protein